MPSDYDPTDPTIARLLDVMAMVAARHTQQEIADKYGVTARAVRKWIAKGRELRLAMFKGTPPDEMLARTDHIQAHVQARLLRRLEAAESAGDDRTFCEIARQLRQLERDRYLILARVGYFDGYRFNPPGGDIDPAAEGAEMLRRLARQFLDGEFREADEDG